MLDVFRTLHHVLGDIDGADAVREAVVFAAWRRIAGEALAEHAVPVRLYDGTLSVAVSSITWQRHLKDLCGQMVFRINAALGVPTVTFIDLRIDEKAVLENRAEGTTGHYLNSDDAVKEISPELARAADNIADDSLRRQFLLAAGSCLGRMRRRREAVRGER
jgi:hypothetical protein